MGSASRPMEHSIGSSEATSRTTTGCACTRAWGTARRLTMKRGEPRTCRVYKTEGRSPAQTPRVRANARAPAAQRQVVRHMNIKESLRQSLWPGRIALTFAGLSLVLTGAAGLRTGRLHYQNYWGGSVFAPLAIVVGIAALVVVIVRWRSLNETGPRPRGKALRRQQRALEDGRRLSPSISRGIPEWVAKSVHGLGLQADPPRFPKGSVEFDCALVMRNVAHKWRSAEDLYV